MLNDLIDILPKDSWFRKWMVAWPLCTAPRAYVLLSAVSALGAVVGRGVWFDHDVHTLYPMLNLLLIGPSGIGKTTALEMGLGLIQSIPEDQRPMMVLGKATPEKLHFDLVMQPQAVLYAEELAAFFNKQKYMEGMIPYVTALLNVLPMIEERTKTGAILRVVNPTVTVMGGSTKEWLQEQLPDSATTGGFLARFLIVHEEYPYRKIALPGLAMGTRLKAEVEARRDKIVGEFMHLTGATRGEIRFRDYGAVDVYSRWHDNFVPESGYLAPFAARAGEFVLRLSMLMAVSAYRKKILVEDVKAAIHLYELCSKKLGRVVIPFSPDGKLLDAVLTTVGQQDMDQVSIRRALRNITHAHKVDALIDSLIASEDLERLPSGQLRRIF